MRKGGTTPTCNHHSTENPTLPTLRSHEAETPVTPFRAADEDASGLPGRHPRPTTQRTTRELVDIEIMDGFSLQTDSSDAWRGFGDSVTTPLNNYYIWQMHQHQRIRTEPKTGPRDPLLGECYFNLNEPRTALRKHQVGDWNFQVLRAFHTASSGRSGVARLQARAAASPADPAHRA